MTITDPIPREELRRSGRRLEWFSIGYNLLEAVFALASGMLANSIALIGFGLDSCIELTSALALMWRLQHDQDVEWRERRALRIVGCCLLALAVFVTYESVETLLDGERPRPSTPGLIIATLSVLIMPWLARAKRNIAHALNSAALAADSRQTDFCAYLSVILLAGLALNQFFGLWWADPVASLGMAAVMVREGYDAVRARACGCH